MYQILFAIFSFLQGLLYRVTGWNNPILPLLALASPIFVLVLGAYYPSFSAEILFGYFVLVVVLVVFAFYLNYLDYQKDREGDSTDHDSRHDRWGD